jgi:hypothetical protein
MKMVIAVPSKRTVEYKLMSQFYGFLLTTHDRLKSNIWMKNTLNGIRRYYPMLDILRTLKIN